MQHYRERKLEVSADNKIESFALSPDRKTVYAGTVSGVAFTLSSDDLSMRAEFFAHSGIISAVSHHPNLPYMAMLSGDNTISIWRTSQSPRPVLVTRVPTHSLRPRNDLRPISDFQSESQALAFHDTRQRVATRSANGALLEFDFDDFGDFRYVSCIRLFPDADLTSVRYVPGTSIVMGGSIDGSIVLSHGGQIVGNIAIPGGGNVHWMEHMYGDTFLVANDTRYIARVKISDKETIVCGKKFPRDDLEYVALSDDKQVAFAASFDRKIYTIDPESCEMTGVTFDAPFKCRWVRPVATERIIVQTRDGGLHLVDTKEKKATHSLRATPRAIWSGDFVRDDILRLAGEGREIIDLDVSNEGIRSWQAAIDSAAPETFTKRLIYCGTDDISFLGRSDGNLVSIQGDEVVRQTPFGSAIRDIAILQSDIYLGLEDGRVLRCDKRTHSILSEYRSAEDEPIWSIAVQDDVLAAAERGGSLLLLDAASLEVRDTIEALARPKRMRWISKDRLLYVWSDQLHLYDLATNRSNVLVESIGNTIEDFIIDYEYGHIVMISYMRNIYLARLDTGEIICSTPDGVDYSKGLSWTKRTPRDGQKHFVTFGRHGSINVYRIVNEKIHFFKSLPVS